MTYTPSDQAKQTWSQIVATNRSVELTTVELDLLLSALFETNSANFRAISSVFNLMSHNDQLAFDEASAALEDVKTANDHTGKLMDRLVERLK